MKSVNNLLDDEQPCLEVVLDADPRCKRRCSCCIKPGRVHDNLPERSWHFVPIWNMPVKPFYTPRRVICPMAGAPTVEALPWSRG